MYLFFLSILQGVGELLPISSSAHIHILSAWFNYPEMGKNIDVALHLGTLLAYILCFWKTMVLCMMGTWQAIKKPTAVLQGDNPGFRIAMMLVLVTVPSILVGYFVKKYVVIDISLTRYGYVFIFFGAIMWAADRFGGNSFLSNRGMLLMGLGQVMAFIPGASRLGSCLTAARMAGVNRGEAVRFSFVMAIPVLLGACALSFWQMWQENTLGDVVYVWPAIVATFFINVLLLPLAWRLMVNYTLAPFAIYRIAFGLLLLALGCFK